MNSIDNRFSSATGLNATFLPGSFNLMGSATEPLLQGNVGTNFSYSSLDFTAAGNLNAFFSVPSRKTASYSGTKDIKIDIDFCLSGTLTNTQTVIFGIGLIEINSGTSIDTTPPISGTGYGSVTYTLGSSEVSLGKITVTITIPATSTISNGEQWVGRLKRVTDTSVALVKVLGITVYE